MKGELSRKELEEELEKLTKANNMAFKSRNKIYEHCNNVYGYDPSNCKNEDFIDGVDGGMGDPTGMSVDEFEKSMVDSIDFFKRTEFIC